MKQNLIIFILILILILIFINKIKTKNKKNEYYFNNQFLSNVQKAELLREKIEEGIMYYNEIKKYIPKLKELYSTFTDWNILKSKMCTWASNNKLLPSLIELIDRIVNEYTNIPQNTKLMLEKVRKMLLKLMSYTAVAMVLKNLVSLISPPKEVISAINVFINIDNSILELLKTSGISIC